MAAAVGAEILSFNEHAVGSGPDAVAYVEARIGGAVVWGAGRDASVLTAGVRAVLSAAARAGAGRAGAGRAGTDRVAAGRLTSGRGRA